LGLRGGINAVYFGHESQEYYGVDIASTSLEECGRQMALEGMHNFIPVLIASMDPEAALTRVPGPCELFVSTYVFELLPSAKYGIRVLKIAYELLAPGGLALIQIKYNEANWKTASRNWNYAKNLAWNATYRIEEFWLLAQECGFRPKMVTLLPNQVLVNDRNYAYFLLQKPTVP
jgi:hypothetical protein